MSQWLVTQNDSQFSVEGLAELKEMARAGKLGPGDMIQPPGANDWIYAIEVDDLKDLLETGSDDDDIDDYLAGRGGMGKILPMVAAGIFVVLILVGGGASFVLYQQLPTGSETLIGEGGLSYSEMLTTASAPMYGKPDAGSKAVHTVPKDTVLDLLAKRGDFYKARTKTGKEGWVMVDQVIPMYQLGGERVREKYDPLYNPDKYLDVRNARWSTLPDKTEERITVFQFQLNNKSDYMMTDLVILATIKDAKGHIVEKKEIPIDGMIPEKGRTMVGTLKPEDDKAKKRKRKGKGKKGKGKNAEEEGLQLLTNYTLDKLSLEDEDVLLRFSDGIEVAMESEDFANAEIDILELRAVPDDEAKKYQAKIEKLQARKGQ